MAERVGIDLSDVVAAIGDVEGGLPSYDGSSLPNAKAPVTPNTFCINPEGSLKNVTERQGTICNGRTAVTHYELIGGDDGWCNIPMNDSTKTLYNRVLRIRCQAS